MEYEMQYLMHLTRCGACGEEALPPTQPPHWERLLQLAYEQDVLYTAFLPVKKQGLGCPATLIEQANRQLRGKAIENSMRTEGILSLIAQAQAQDIQLLIIKGYDIARFYRYPECRVSADTDFLVCPEDEAKAFAFLQSAGFAMEPRREDSNHAVGRHPQLGVVELHSSLITARFAATLFAPAQLNERAFDNIQKVHFGEGSFYALESTNALLFITFHLIKHFLFNGISLKMMFDTALYAKNNLDTVDKVRYYEALKQSGYLHFMQIVFGAMVRYGGFEAADFPITPATEDGDITALLDALERDGSMGKNNEDAALEAWMFYNYRFARESGNAYDMELVKNGTRQDIVHALFPPKTVLARRYPTLLRHAWLYPFCWLHRLFTRGLRFLFSSKKISKRKISDESELSSEARERIALFRQFRIM